LVQIRSRENRVRTLIFAFEYEDDTWIDITEQEKNKKIQAETRSQEFSLSEIVALESRINYQFQTLGFENVSGYETNHLVFEALEPDEERFSGDLWFDRETFALVKAQLVPSEFPTGLKNMMMIFYLEKFGKVWLPVKIYFDAEISFLIFFKAQVISEILFEDYRFDQSFPDSLFSF